MISSLNHITLATQDLDRAIEFYRDVLGASLAAKWQAGAYVELGDIWICLELSKQVSAREDDSHIAFSCASDDFENTAAHIRAHARIWKENKSEGASVYFLDPDGHKFELHDGSLASRLAHYRANPENGVTVFPTAE